MLEEEENTFTFALTTDKMIISSDDEIISLKTILELTENIMKTGIFTIGNGIPIEINEISGLFLSFKILGKIGEKILRNPLKVKINGNYIEIVCEEQLEYFFRNFKKPKISCSCNGKLNEVSIRNISSHIDPNEHFLSIIDYEEFLPKSEISTELIVNKDNKIFLNTALTSPRKSTIINILKKEKKNNDIYSIFFLKTTSNIQNDENKIYISSKKENNLLLFFYSNGSLISKIIDNNNKVENNISYLADNFDVYKIVTK